MSVTKDELQRTPHSNNIMKDNAAIEQREQDGPQASASKQERKPNYLWSLPVIVVLAAIAILTFKVLIPTAKDPESKLYSSSLGYPAQQRRSGEPIEVAVTKVSDTQFSESIAAAGETIGLVDVDVRPQLTGVVETVLVEEGQRVRKGDNLLTLVAGPSEDRLAKATAQLVITELAAEYDPQVRAIKRVELEATVAKAEKLLEIAEGRLERYTSLRDARAASPEEIADVEELRATRLWELTTAQQQLKQHLTNSEHESKESPQTLEQRKAAVREAERDLKNTAITAPCDGLVTSVSAQPGELVVHEVAAVSLADNIVFKAFIDQTGINAVQIGDSALVRLIAHPGEQFYGTVIRVNPSIDTRGTASDRGRVDTRFTYSAWVKLDNNDLPPGMQGHVEFHKQLTHPSLPESAVIHLSGGEGMVMIIRNGRAVINRVELGAVRDGLREVKSGLYPSDQVVQHPLGLQGGDLLRPSGNDPGRQESGTVRMLSQHEGRAKAALPSEPSRHDEAVP